MSTAVENEWSREHECPAVRTLSTSIFSSPRHAPSVASTRPAPAHYAFTRLLHRLEPDPAALWEEVESLVDRTKGILVGDDSTLDKPYARKMGLVTRHWSGKHHAVVAAST